MPALPTVTFTSTDSTSNAPIPVAGSPGVWTIYGPDSCEAINSDTITQIDMHYTITIPLGFTGIFTPQNDDIVGADYAHAMGQIIPGTGAAVAFKVLCCNTGAINRTPPDNSILGTLSLLKLGDYKHDDSAGTW